MLLIVISYEHTKSIGVTMGVTFAAAVGSMVAGSFAGVFVDRTSPVKIMILAHLISAAVIATLFWLPTNAWIYYGAAFSVAVLSSFATPAFQKYQVMIIAPDELLQANASIQTLREIAKITGPALAVFVLSWLPSSSQHVGFLIDAVSYLLAAALLFIGGEQSSAQPKPSADSSASTKQKGHFLKDWREGLQPLKNPLVTNVLLLYFFILIGIAGFDVLLTAHVSLAGHSTLNIGYVIATLSCGLIVASLIASRFMAKWPLSLQLGGSALGLGLFYATIGSVDEVVAMGIAAFALGICNAFYNVSAATYWQQHIPLDQLGRFFGLVSSLFSAVTITGMSLAGLLGTLYTPGYTLQLMGGIIAAAGFVSIFAILRFKHPNIVPDQDAE